MKSTLERASRQSWLRQHWKLVLSVWIVIALLGAVTAFLLIRNSEITKLALSTAESNPNLVQRLGSPIKTGWFISGNIEVNPSSGHAELAIPISGPKGKGTVYAEARKRAGIWKLEMLQFGPENSNDRLDLLVEKPNPN